MRQPCLIAPLLVLTLLVPTRRMGAQANRACEDQSAGTYSVNVSANEVVLTFHAADVHGRSINDLRIEELSLYDNERRPRQILAFQSLQNLPIRAGILLDKSESMERAVSRAIAVKYTQRILRQQLDQAFVMDFASRSQTIQPWTSNTGALTAGLRSFVDVAGHVRGTAIFDAVYRACSNEFGHLDHGVSGNFILLFSDGEDNASRTSLSQAITACQRASTAIYVFRPESGSSSTGLSTLRTLADESGGRVFRANESDEEVEGDLRTIEADLRDQYRLIYRPQELKHDGSFHSIALITPLRASSVTVRSGYYAPLR